MAKSNINAWREILTRIFDGLTFEQNITPAWLVNPVTKRQLKLDLFYPQIGLAVRFSGLRGNQQRGGQSLAEKAQQRARDAARDQVTEKHGVSLALLDVAQGEPHDLFDTLEQALSRATRRLREDETIAADKKGAGLDRLQQARSKAWAFRRKIKSEKDLALYLDLWRDRQFREAETVKPTSPPQAAPPLLSLAAGMAVEHSHFGPGIIQSITPGPNDAEALITIRFETAEERTFMAGLLAGKLMIK